jgi:hypothetical protein
MEESTLNKILLAKDELLLTSYMRGIRKILKEIYGNQLLSLIKTIEDTTSVEKKQLIFLMTLNNENALKKYFLQSEPTLSAKLRSFYDALDVCTGQFLDFQMDMNDYLEQCRDLWIIS